jgi:hypothetical protein
MKFQMEFEIFFEYADIFLAFDRGATCNYCRMKQLIWTVTFILPSPASSLPFIMFNSEFKLDTSDELQV